MKELLRTSDPTVMAFAKAMLSGERIEAFEIDTHMSILEGGTGLFPRRLLVHERDLFAARAVLADIGIGLGDVPR